jgi:hypothetical protein
MEHPRHPLNVDLPTKISRSFLVELIQFIFFELVHETTVFAVSYALLRRFEIIGQRHVLRRAWP